MEAEAIARKQKLIERKAEEASAIKEKQALANLRIQEALERDAQLQQKIKVGPSASPRVRVFANNGSRPPSSINTVSTTLTTNQLHLHTIVQADFFKRQADVRKRRLQREEQDALALRKHQEELERKAQGRQLKYQEVCITCVFQASVCVARRSDGCGGCVYIFRVCVCVACICADLCGVCLCNLHPCAAGFCAVSSCVSVWVWVWVGW
jgi:hypothetical protein